ncbi:hypothetical protein [Sphingopyxis sp. BE259]|nr:hypothetical protein [Sphingopyxis sp. BE259]
MSSRHDVGDMGLTRWRGAMLRADRAISLGRGGGATSVISLRQPAPL